MGVLGIVFAGGEGPGPQKIKNLFNSLEAETLTAAADSGLLIAEAAGLQPDWIIGDMDSLGDENCLQKYPAQRVIRCAAEKDHSDTELALSLLWEKGCGDVWIIGGGGGRIDHLFGIRDLFERERFPRRWITAAEDIYCIEGGSAAGQGGAADSGGLIKACEVGCVVSVFPLGAGPWKASSQGLKWPLDKVRWERGVYGLSNITAAAELAVNAIQGRLLIILTPVQSQNTINQA